MEDQPFQLAAALSYYTLFSLAPLLVIVISIAGFAFVEMRHKIESSKLSRAWLGEKAQRRSRQSFKMRAVSPILASYRLCSASFILLVGAAALLASFRLRSIPSGA